MTLHSAVELLFVLLALGIVFGSYQGWWRPGVAGQPTPGFAPQAMISLLVSLVFLLIIYLVVVRFV